MVYKYIYMYIDGYDFVYVYITTLYIYIPYHLLPHDGVWREGAGLIFSGKGPCNIIKCKAHQVVEELQGHEELIAQGNDAADQKAKEGADLCTLMLTAALLRTSRSLGSKRWSRSWGWLWHSGLMPMSYSVTSGSWTSKDPVRGTSSQ